MIQLVSYAQCRHTGCENTGGLKMAGAGKLLAKFGLVQECTL